MNSFRKNLLPLALLACVGSGLVSAVNAQTPPPAPPPRTVVRPPRDVPPAPIPSVDSEHRIAAAPNVNVKFCVSEAELKVNGWDRDEVRVFVRNGRKTGFKVLEKDAGSGKANWLWIAPAVDNAATRVPMSDCLSGSSIEIDVPMKATLSITGRSTETVIDTVRKVEVKIIEGNISLRNIAGGISAFAYQGDLTVENSAGAIAIESTTGNIIAYDVTPGEIGEMFRVRSNSGTVMLQNVEHRQIEANTITGAVNFDGKLLPGGVYAFKTSNGAIRLNVPDDTSATFQATYGFGSFNSDFKLDYTYEVNSSAGKNIIAKLGGGAANVKLTTNNGSIRVNKRK